MKITARSVLLLSAGVALGCDDDFAGPIPIDDINPPPVPEAVVDWIKGNAIPISSAVPTGSFSDLEPLRELIGDARVVALGEATHGTREFFQMKHRLLRFLVQEMGFNVFAMEASMPESVRMDRYVKGAPGDPAELLSGLYFWTWNTEEVLALIEWMRSYNEDPSHASKVKFYGFDMQTPTVATRPFAYWPAAMLPAQFYRDCPLCPQMIKMKSGAVTIQDAAAPCGKHRIVVARPFSLGKYEITRGQFADFVEATAYKTGRWQARPEPALDPAWLPPARRRAGGLRLLRRRQGFCRLGRQAHR